MTADTDGLVERLRRRTISLTCTPIDGELLDEAAAEIKRLTAALFRAEAQREERDEALKPFVAYGLALRELHSRPQPAGWDQSDVRYRLTVQMSDEHGAMIETAALEQQHFDVAINLAGVRGEGEGT